MEITKVKIKLRNKALRDNGGYYGSAAAALLPSLSDYVTGDYLIENYVAKEAGKGLSANNFTDDLLAKLNGIEAGANKYVHPTATATTIPPAARRVLAAIKVNSLGHVTSVSSKVLAASDIPALDIAKITGLQDALDAKVAQSDFDTFKNLFDSMFEKVTENGVTSIKAKYGLWTNEFLSCLGLNSSGSGGSGGSYNRLDNWADYAADKAGWVLSAKLGYDLWLNKADKSTVNAIASRVTTLEGKNYLDALTLVTSGSGNAVTSVSLSADKKTLTVNKDAMARALYSISGTMNSLTAFGNALGMVNLQSASALVNPNGQTGWHHFINMSFAVSGQETNMWQTQIANAAGTTDLWVRSRDGGALSDSTAWKAPWTRILTGTNYSSVLDTRYYTKSEVDTKDKRLTTYYAVRPTSANVNFGNAAGLYTFLAASVMTTGKPAVDSHILHMEWDNSLSYAAQLALPAGADASMQWRWQRNTTWQAWRTLLDTNNYAATLDTRYVTLDTAQTISGQKTFEAKVILKSPCTSNMGYSDTNGPRLEFHNGDSTQNLALIFTDFDSYRSPAGLKIIGNQGNEWLEAPRFIKSGGTSSQFLMADGSLATKHTMNTATHLGWNGTQGQVATIDTLAYWNGRYSPGSSNLQYCDRGRFGDIVTHSHSEYVTALGTSGNSLTWNRNGVANNITVPYATKTRLLEEATGLARGDNDSSVEIPSSLPAGIRVRFKNGTGAASVYYWNTIVDLTAFSGSSGSGAGHRNQFLFSNSSANPDGSFWVRNGVDSTWHPWRLVLTDSNFSSVLNSRYVTLNTAQTINGAKTFDNKIYAKKGLSLMTTASASEAVMGCIGFNRDTTNGAIPNSAYTAFQFTQRANVLGLEVYNSKTGTTFAVGCSITASSFIKSGGTSAQFLKADGSVDGTSYVNKAGDTMTGALLAPKVEVGHMYWDGTGIMPSTVGHLQYTCGKADGRWANVFTRTINVTSTDLVSNLNADMLDGFHKESFDGYRYTKIDASALDNNTWYPVVFRVPQALQTRIRIEGGSAANASWNGRSDKRMSVVLDYTVQGSEWGWVTPQRVINLFILGAGASGSNCIAGLGQLTNNSWEYVMVRGGAVYNFYISHWLVPELKTSTFTNQNQSVSPTTTSPTAITRNNAWITDNVASATKLLTARTLWGKSFDGTGNVSGDIELAMSNASSSNNSGKLWFNGVLRGQTTQPVTGPYMMGMNVGTYGRKRLGVFQHNADSYTVEPTEVLSILPSGNVGIGTTSPAYKLDVKGVVRATTGFIAETDYAFRAVYGNLSFLIVNDGENTGFLLTDPGDPWGYYNRLLPIVIENSTGAVWLSAGTAMVNPGSGMDIIGTLYASVGIWSNGYVSARGQNTSDVRLKTDLCDFRASDIIRSLRPVAFRWNELARSRFSVFDTDAVQYGLIAQEVLETAPWLVDTDMFKDGYMGVWYDKLIPVLLKGEIELLRVTDDHEERIKALERENEELRKEIIELQTR